MFGIVQCRLLPAIVCNTELEDTSEGEELLSFALSILYLVNRLIVAYSWCI